MKLFVANRGKPLSRSKSSWKSAGATPGAPPPEPWTISLSDFGSILKSIRKTPSISKASDRWDMSSTTTQTREDDHSRILGIDVGSVSLSVAEINLKREILKTAYRFHHGDVRGALREALNDFDLEEIRWVAATSSTPSILKTNRRYDNRVAIMEAARHFHQKIGSILVVGGEAFGLIGFDGNGKYRSFRTNTSCAAGTGSFLDQQARRLNLESTEALSRQASSNRGTVPKMASRCAVFAKTDLVHAQQEGYSLEQICDGLCHGLARNIVDTLSMDREARAPILFTGGVSRNRAVVRHIESITGKDVVVDETGIYGAIGAAFLLAGERHEEDVTPIGSADDLLLPRDSSEEVFPRAPRIDPFRLSGVRRRRNLRIYRHPYPLSAPRGGRYL